MRRKIKPSKRVSWRSIGCLLFCLVLWVAVIVYATTFSDTYDTATPAGSDDPAEADDRMREIKGAVQERENVDHYWPLTGTEVSDADSGEHRKILFHAPIAATPTVAADHGDLRIKDVSSKAELHWTDEDENEIQLTSKGNNLANDTYLTGTDAAGTGSVNLIKAGTNDLATLPDSAEMASNAAPVEDEAIANKKYVDDNVGSANWTPTSYAGEESITFPNGLIFKQGTVAASTNPQTITFGAAFPTAAVSASANGGHTTIVDQACVIDSLGTASMIIRNNAVGTLTTFHWQVWGY